MQDTNLLPNQPKLILVLIQLDINTE
ncbi:protein of unknown function [Shewanella benthica]|uniref:Uncharacterized protein n=1 Tax=Shewanella benthica TaxID=43661 RepID=A0A330LW75_9GAMM|nr:protein of unknown function [Shewanella benthica]